MCQEQRTADHTTSNFTTQITGPGGNGRATRHSSPTAAAQHGTDLLRPTWGAASRASFVAEGLTGDLPVRQGQGLGGWGLSHCSHWARAMGEGGGRWVQVHGASVGSAPAGYVHHEIIGAAHVSVNINGGCTDACANVARAWQALHVIRVTRRHSNRNPHSRHVYHRVPHGVTRVQGRAAM